MTNKRIEGVHHIQLAMPAGGEAHARDFYGSLLGMAEIAKPARLVARGGVGFNAALFNFTLASMLNLCRRRKRTRDCS